MEDNLPVENQSAAPPQNNEKVPVHSIFQKYFKAIVALGIIAVVFLLIKFLPVGQYKGITGVDQQVGQAKTFTLAESDPSDQKSGFSTFGQPTFVFSKRIGVSENELSKYFKITPSVPGSWHLEKNGQVVYFSSDNSQYNGFPNTFAFNTVYTVTVDKAFHASDNQSLQNTIAVSFRTKQNPAFNLNADYKLLSTTPGQPVTVGFSTYSAESKTGALTGHLATVVIQNATENQLLTYFSYKTNKNPLYQFVPDPASVIQQEVQTVLQDGGYGNYQIQLGSTAFPNPGLYFVTVKTDTGSEDFFVVASSHVNQVYGDANATYVWASKTDTGSSLGGVTTDFYKDTGSPVLVDTVSTGTDGIAKSSHSLQSIDFVITRSNNDVAVTFTTGYGFLGYRLNNLDTYQTYSYSDRPVYRPGDLVHYKAIVRQKLNGQYVLPAGKLYVQFIPDYASVADDSYKAIDIDANGTVATDIQLPQMTTGTYPQVTLSVKNTDGTYRQIDSLPLVVQSYRKPDMDITTTAVEKEYISSDSAHFTVYAKTSFGQPLSNVDFSYRVLVSSFQEVKDRTKEDVSGSVSGYYGTGDELASGIGKFDAKGIAHITFQTSLPAKYEASQIATLEITPNIGASPSIGKIAKLIHRGEFALFIDNLTGDTDTGISGTVSSLNHASPRQPQASKSITLSLYKIIDYNNKQLMLSQQVVTGADGTSNFSFPKVDSGSYEVVAQATDGRGNVVTVRQQIYVGLQKFSQYQPQYTIDLKAAKNTYKINDIANISVTANFTVGDAIMILANEGGSSSNIVSIEKNSVGSNSWNVAVPIKASYGQVISVEIFTVNNGKIVQGQANIVIDSTQQKINTTISFDKQVYKPGDTVSAKITTTDQQGNPVSADNSLSVIDASLLQIGQLNGDAFNNFYGDVPYVSVAHFDSTTGIRRDVGGGGGGCFLEGTQILMSNGTTKNIEDVKIGDQILTRSSDISPEMVSDTVTKTFRHNVTDYMTINNTLNVTWIHRIFLNNSWQEAKDARVGDTLLDANGNSIKITSIVYHTGQFVVYNLTTARFHTFFADGFYVHNEKGLGPRENFVDTAYWNAHIQTDTSGQATVSFTLPDNLTTFTAQVFSNSKDSQFGQTTADFVSQQNFNIVPVVANYYYLDDQPVVSALFQNSSDNDVTAQVTLSVKELGFTKTQTFPIHKNDFETASFPMEKITKTGVITFLIEARDDKNNLLDSVQVKKTILPKGAITSSWSSFSGSKTISLMPTYPALDFNTASLIIAPNIASKLFTGGKYINQEQSTSTGQNIYAYAYMLAKTRDGEINPTAYDYATLKNDFRDSVESLLQHMSGDHWNLPPYNENDSFVSMNLWLAQGFIQAQTVHMLDEIGNIGQVAENVKHYIATLNQSNQISAGITSVFSQFPQQVSESTDEKIARQWILNQAIPDGAFQNSPESAAIRVMQGDVLALSQLRSMKLPSADDRYLWDGDTQYAQILPVLAMVQKGTTADADKAIKGLSVSINNTDASPLAILAGVLYAERNNLYVDSPAVTVSVNDSKVFMSKKQDAAYSDTLLLKNAPNGKTSLQINVTGTLPVYSTLVQTDYANSPIAASQVSLLDQISQLFTRGTTLPEGKPQYVDISLTRVLKDTQSGQDMPEIKPGETGIVALTGDNLFSKYMSSKSTNWAEYNFKLTDAISPSFIYLIQSNDFSNSPQYQSVLSRVFPGSNANSGSAILPSDYSDQAVFFDDTSSYAKIILPYVVYNVSGGTYYQPKTSIVFPIFGIIANEK